MGRAGEGLPSRESIVKPFLPAWSALEWISALVLLLAVFVAYLPVWKAGFVWDDSFYLTDNPNLIDMRGLTAIWTGSAADISPLAITTFWVEHALWGFAPLPYHLVNVLEHGACALLLWRVLFALGIPGAWLGASLWALHPVNVESVAWVTELKNTQSGGFFLLAILFFMRWQKAKAADAAASAHGDYALVLFFAALAMATKSSTVILPAVLCLVAWWMEGRWQWRNLVRVAPVFLLTLAASAVSIWTQSLALSTLNDPGLARSFPERIVTAGVAVWFYLGKLVWPHPVMTVYPRWTIDASIWTSYLPVLAVVVTFFILWLKRDSWAWAPFFAFAYFLFALLPVLGMFDNYIFQYSLVFDHFQYLSSMGPMALAGAGLVRLADRIIPGNRVLPSALGVMLLLVLGVLSWQRAATFQSEETLWADTVAKNPESWTGHYNLGIAAAKHGRNDEAKFHFHRAIDIYPRYANARSNLAMLLLKEGHPDEALVEINQALKIDPKSGEVHRVLGWALWKKGHLDEATAAFKKATELDPTLPEAACGYGQILLEQGQIDQAIVEFGKAINLNPNLVEVYYNLGKACMKKGQTDLGIAAFEKSLEIDPTKVDAYDELGLALVQKGQLNDGVIQYQKALEIDPKSAPTESNLGVALFQAGLKDEAMKHLRKAMELDPASAEANSNLGNACLATGQLDAAIAHYQKALSLDAAFNDAHRNLGVAYLYRGRPADAIVQFQEVLKINPGDTVTQGLLAKAQAMAAAQPPGRAH